MIDVLKGMIKQHLLTFQVIEASMWLTIEVGCKSKCQVL